MLYNAARFGSPLDFGYAHLASLPLIRLKYGLFFIALHPLQFLRESVAGLETHTSYPWWVPVPFGGSVFLSSPWLLSLLHRGDAHPTFRLPCSRLGACANVSPWRDRAGHARPVVLLQPGRLGFSYRYFMVVLPWLALLQLESVAESPRVVGVDAARALCRDQ